jgi:Tetratricopeptide repeat
MLEALMALAGLAGNTVVVAATTDAWEAARREFARLLGRGDTDKTKAAERRLEQTRDQLTNVAGADLEQVRAALEAQWVIRLTDLLEDDPGVEAELRAVVEEIRSQLPGGTVAAGDHSVAAARDVNITASGGGTAAGVIYGNVAPPKATSPRSGEPPAGPEIGVIESGAVVAIGGVAAGQLQLPPQEATAGQPVRLPPHPPPLAGREALLAQLDARLSAADGPAVRTVALCGMGGVGKTSVAVEYAHRHLVELGVAWQFPADDATVLAAGFGELAAQLGVRGLADTRDPVASVHAVLGRFPASWLLIFDNAADMASVAEFLPPAGPGRVLITSQNPGWPYGQVLPVPLLDAEVAADYLVTRTGDADRQAALELAAELGGLPLALEQAAAYIQASGGSLAGYLASFRKRRPEMLAHGETGEYGKTVATTWSLAFTDMERSAPRAVGLLRLLAFCAPEPVPLRLLLQPQRGMTRGLSRKVAKVLAPLLSDELAAGDAVATLRRYSLVTLAGDGLVLVHRLVQAVTADQMPEGLRQRWRAAAATVIEAAIPVYTGPPESWPTCALLLPHAQAVLPDDSNGMARLAYYLGSRGSYAASINLQQRILAAWERSRGAEHPDTLSARANLASWTGQAGDAGGARDQYADLLTIEARVLGAEHRETLAARGNLAHFIGTAGDVAGARAEFAALLPIRERVCGPEDPSTLSTRANLASWTGQAGDAAGARDQYADLLTIEARVLGAEHPDTMAARGNLARWTGEAGDAAGAREQYAALLPIFERVLGPEHPHTLNVRVNLASWTGRAGDATEALNQYDALLPIRERVSGPGHPDTLSDRGGLAAWTGGAGDAAGARDQYAALLPIRERVSGPGHPDTLITRGNLARWTGEAGDAAGALNQYAALLPIFERVLGVEHPDTLTIRANLAAWTERAGGPSAWTG